ncbi:MAG: PIN-like domain-containing protein [Bacteroidota bacterium]
MELQIETISFGTIVKDLKLKEYVDSIELYKSNFKKTLELKEETPIFIDTNILLRYYSISFSNRKILFDFFKKYKRRIFVTSQVQKEFVKNREDIIGRFFNETLDKLEENFRDEIKNKVQSYIQRNKILLNDFPIFEGQLSKINSELDNTQKQLTLEIEGIKEKLNDTKYEDEFLSLIQEMNLIAPLTQEDSKFLIKEFDSFLKRIDVSKIKSEISKPQNAFPGLSDVKAKPQNPYGDYLIFHEMIKYMKINSKNAIFLTYDTTKGDWIKENKEPHSHYIQVVYAATGKSLFFVDAERFFDSHLQKHFNSIIPNRNYYSPRSKYEKDYISEFEGFESIIRTIAEFVVIENYEDAPLFKLINEFLERNYIDKEFKREFYDLNYFKNFLIHTYNRSKIDSVSDDVFINFLERLDNAISTMNSLYSTL